MSSSSSINSSPDKASSQSQAGTEDPSGSRAVSRTTSANEVPFFTVAHYRNPISPTTYELPVATVSANPIQSRLSFSSINSEDSQNSQGAGEDFYKGSVDLMSPVSPLELAFGNKIRDINGEWLGKSVEISASAVTSSRNRSPSQERPANNAQSKNISTDSVQDRSSQDNTPVGCLHAASGITTGRSNTGSSDSRAKTKEDVPVRGCDILSKDESKPIVQLRPKASYTWDKQLIQRRVSAPTSGIPEEKKSVKITESHRNSISEDYFMGTTCNRRHSERNSFDKNEFRNSLRNTDRESGKDFRGEKATVYEDASVTDAGEKLEQPPKSTSSTPRTPKSKSRETSFCLDTDDQKYPKNEAEYVALLQRKIAEAHERQLLPLKEDLADWLTKLIGAKNLTSENLLSSLDNGVLVCQLASLISTKAQQARETGTSTLEVPRLPYRTWPRARSGSFFARDNISNFIRFCRRLGVHDNLLFETEDLVCGTGTRGVVLCILEVGRLAQLWWNVEPPGIVKLERELDGEELSGRSDSGYSNASSPRGSTLTLQGASPPSLAQPPAKPPRPKSAPSNIPVISRLKIHKSSFKNQGCQTGFRDFIGTRPRTNFPRGPKPLPPPKPASISKAVSSLVHRPSTFPSFRSYDRGWSGAKTTPTTPVTTPIHTPRTRLPVSRTPKTSGRSSPNTTPTTPTQCRRYLVSMQRSPSPSTPSKPFVSKYSKTTKTPPKSPTCSKLQEMPYSQTTEEDNVELMLDNKVKDIAEQASGLCVCRRHDCRKPHIRRVADGKYDVLGRNIFVRLLKGKHVMVRVGGGWDTLEHYLLRHNPSQVTLLKTKTSETHLHAHGIYRGSTSSRQQRPGSGTDSSRQSSSRSSPSCSDTEKSNKTDDNLSRGSTPTEDITLEQKEKKTNCNKLGSSKSGGTCCFRGAPSCADSCDLLSAPMGENGDFQPPTSLSSSSNNIMMASCPSLVLAETHLSQEGFHDPLDDSKEPVHL